MYFERALNDLTKLRDINSCGKENLEKYINLIRNRSL